MSRERMAVGSGGLGRWEGLGVALVWDLLREFQGCDFLCGFQELGKGQSKSQGTG